ncbi:aldo/keto reductase [Pseudomonas aeruginosa]|uniref:Aldo/keto reductase n=1 Tax=Cronobacter universalis NCTC 9529 TaxID=1074000 RepID=A0AAC8VM05_9ENTR|nr:MULTISPECIES: aldo/keto reductase [Gammaproteobacteria]ALB53338.1 aldo/keto reductase [Cronobacter universalis NCTC 9529]ALB70285.1 aldo/keto reductase [Cronobacter muytjensii ATCC 51329]ALZ10867.1 aldo/keto reductase [Pseudomonas aeruginosa]KSL00331.1 aldo/keto reductase [Pseudomonas aeruginosa]MBF1859754.1 aldo/keto reductase [Pseudomonas aeruginosa]
MNSSLPSTNEFRLGGELPINRLGFGAMRLPCNGFRGPARDPETGRAVLRRAVELGVNHIDTAEFYQSTDGSVRANALIREALYPYRSNLVIATKVGVVFNPDGSHRPATGADMRRLVEENLSSLGLDRLDLVYLRIGEMTVPHGESLAERFEALAALRAEGLIRHLGISNVDIGHFNEARAIAPIAAVQNNFHIAKREDLSLLKACEEAGIAFCPFFPLGGGMGEIDDGRLARVAGRHGATPSQIALAWLLASSPVMLAIPGTGSVEHLQENVAAGGISLTEEDHAELA